MKMITFAHKILKTYGLTFERFTNLNITTEGKIRLVLPL